MSAKDNPPSGLFSKVAKFVRNPTTNWSDLDKQDAEPEDPGYSKQALKEMIERKRQNDFVRKREFDQLRKLRSRGAGSAELARPSYFQSSLPANSDERKMTIKKIDEIEAQMSNQWWQGKQGAASAATAGAGSAPPPPAAPASQQPVVSDPGNPSSANLMASSQRAPASRREADVSDPMLEEAPAAAPEDRAYAPTKLAPMQPAEPPPSVDPADFPPTRPNSGFGRHAGMTTVPGASELGSADVLPSHVTPARAASNRGASKPAFGESQSFAVEMVDGASDPDLEEAAIRFANGDNAGAESGLLIALRDAESRPHLVGARISALFDLYRAIGQQARFDAMALEFAERFGRSAPAWFSMPERVGGKVSDTEVKDAASGPDLLRDIPLWRSPPVFDTAALGGVRLATDHAASPWYLDWRALKSIDPAVVDGFGALVARWSTSPVQLRFAGTDALQTALRELAPSGNKAIATSHWQLRMDALRVMDLQDEFELVALDYCVTYEVSPPSWQDTRCSFESEGQSGGIGVEGGVSVIDPREAGDRDETGGGLSNSLGMDGVPPRRVELSGEILGEATDALARLEAAREGADRIVISCANLIRVDFSAAGSILNWTATRQAEGCSLQFRDVHRLVAAFFNVIGIHEHARVVVRST